MTATLPSGLTMLYADPGSLSVVIGVYGATSFNNTYTCHVMLTGVLIDCTASATGACAPIVTQ